MKLRNHFFISIFGGFKKAGILFAILLFGIIQERIMQIHFTGHQLEITDAIKTLTLDKFDRLERHFQHQISNINVVFRVEKLNHIAEATIQVPGYHELHASSESGDLYTAIDYLVEKLDRQLIKHKEKIQQHRNHRDLGENGDTKANRGL